MAQLTVGPVVTPNDIEIAVCETFRQTLPFYLAEVDEQHDLERGTTAPPRSYVARSENERWAEETPPALVVACAGFVGEPRKHGPRGSYGAWWQVNIGVTVGGATEQGTRALAGRHLAAIMLVLGQQEDMGGLAESTDIVGGRIDAIPPQRTLIACEAIANVYVARVLDTRGNLPSAWAPGHTTRAPDSPTPSTVRVRVHPPS